MVLQPMKGWGEVMVETEGMIIKLERFKLNDGPGIRTTVFTKGCPLRCLWCSNPESQESYPEILYNQSLCIVGCRECIKVCPNNSITKIDEKIVINHSLCKKCYRCVEVCDVGALKKVGDIINFEEIYKRVERDIPFYKETKGGVTVSGGEPLNHKGFTRELFKVCRENGIHTALDTSGYGDMDEILRYTDLVLFDMKHIDDSLHKKYTGVSNKIILENIKKVSNNHIPMIIRIPLVPGINDSKENMKQFIEFLKDIRFIRVDLLPYHGLGIDKYTQLGRVYQLEDLKTLEKSDLEEIIELFNINGIKCLAQC